MESLTVIYIGIIIYLTGMLGVGIYASKKYSGLKIFSWREGVCPFGFVLQH